MVIRLETMEEVWTQTVAVVEEEENQDSGTEVEHDPTPRVVSGDWQVVERWSGTSVLE